MPTVRSPLALVVPAFLLALLALLSPTAAEAHSTSRARAQIDLDEAGGIRVELLLSEEDILDLVRLDLSSPKDAAEAREGLLSGRLSTSLPRWLVLVGDERECPVAFREWDTIPPQGVKVVAEARCEALPETLTIHWGLSAVTSLEVIAFATVTAPGGIEHATVFSRRTPKAVLVVKRPSAFVTFGRFFVSGVEHILIGWDHLAFLLALVLACSRWRRLFLVATAFTVAHSVTLALGALDVVRVPSEVVEPIIAASIAVAAAASLGRLLANKLPFPGSERAPGAAALELSLVSGFGLVHGLGFASMLKEALGDGHGIVTSLLAFNLGVEAGQLLALAIAFPLLARVGRSRVGPRVFAALLVGLVLLGVYVAVARVFEG